MITIKFDGACGPQNPGGRCGGGAVILKDNDLFMEVSERYEPRIKGQTSNNVGEYFGLILAFHHLLDNYLQDEEILVMGDSNLVIEQMSGNWKIKKGIYVELANKAKELKANFKNIRFEWIPREENEWADELSKMAIK